MPKPRNSLAGKHFANNGTKAPKLPSAKKKKPRVATAEGSDPPPAGSGGGGGKGAGRSKKSQRSVLGFVLGAAACISVWGWSIMQGAAKRKRDRRLLDSMLRKPMQITEHAACRMDCRFITRPQIEETLRNGRINDRKSEPNLRPCAKYVVDAEVAGLGAPGDVKAVEGVFAACRYETRVLTVIDTKNNWPCGPC